MTSSVFIVDDSAPLREMVEEYLELEPDLTVGGVAASGEEALARLSDLRCDVILIDVSMPGMNGIELVGQLRDRDPGLRCLMYSAHAQEVYVRKAREVGAAGYVMKGDAQTLLEAIREVVSGGEYYSGGLPKPEGER